MPMQTLDKTNAVKAVHSEDNGERTDISESSDAVEWDPWDPPDPPRPPFPPTADFTSKVQDQTGTKTTCSYDIPVHPFL